MSTAGTPSPSAHRARQLSGARPVQRLPGPGDRSGQIEPAVRGGYFEPNTYAGHPEPAVGRRLPRPGRVPSLSGFRASARGRGYSAGSAAGGSHQPDARAAGYRPADCRHARGLRPIWRFLLAGSSVPPYPPDPYLDGSLPVSGERPATDMQWPAPSGRPLTGLAASGPRRSGPRQVRGAPRTSPRESFPTDTRQPSTADAAGLLTPRWRR